VSSSWAECGRLASQSSRRSSTITSSLCPLSDPRSDTDVSAQRPSIGQLKDSPRWLCGGFCRSVHSGLSEACAGPGGLASMVRQDRLSSSRGDPHRGDVGQTMVAAMDGRAVKRLGLMVVAAMLGAAVITGGLTMIERPRNV